ncbi:hypothetical protein OAG34_01210 [bacterium]|jgi:hypothetical protein|nr:hypothetical protein [bacterium]
MSEHNAPAPKSSDDPAFTLPASLAALRLPLCVGGLIVMLFGWWLASDIGDHGDNFGMSVYLTAAVYCMTIVLGCLFFVLIQHLVRAGWSIVVRRIAELVMVMVIPMGILFIPVLASLWTGEGTLYSWDNPEYAIEHGLPLDVWQEKLRWLNQGWFTVRTIGYFAVWSALALFFFKNSVRQDKTGEKAITDKMQYWSGPAVMLFSLTTTFAAFDWVMSLAPMWFSTMFGVYLFAGSILGAHCLLAVVSYVLQKQGALRDEVTVEHYHDLGKLIFGFVFFWTYISFSQFLLIWYGNIPEETEWFYVRQIGSWGYVALALIFFHWMLPFAGTMSRHVRRRPGLVCAWGAYLLIMHYVDVYFMIMPTVEDGNVGGVMGVVASILCVVGMAGLLSGLCLGLAQQNKVVAVRDPRLGESVAFENF